MTFAVLVTVVAARGGSRRSVERTVIATCAVVVCVALGHGLAEAKYAFGVLPIQAPGVRFLPIVNNNHLSALLLLALPMLIGRAVDATREAERWDEGGRWKPSR